LNESTKAASPAFTFAGKHEQKVKNIAPSPNTYNTAGLTARGRKPFDSYDKLLGSTKAQLGFGMLLYLPIKRWALVEITV
jgi:hypothetical protein